MLIIEIHVDKHENQTASTRVAQTSEDAPARTTSNSFKRWFQQIKQTAKNWLATNTTYNRNNGF